ncbi:hypothetical protein [uncultured Algibacter sp.]|nr:hypothetical protein [uncultured Algibacter sp.]
MNTTISAVALCKELQQTLQSLTQLSVKFILPQTLAQSYFQFNFAKHSK